MKHQNPNDTNIQNERECDLVSLRIAQLLEDQSFGFSPITLKNIHKHYLKIFMILQGVTEIIILQKKKTF